MKRVLMALIAGVLAGFVAFPAPSHAQDVDVVGLEVLNVSTSGTATTYVSPPVRGEILGIKIDHQTAGVTGAFSLVSSDGVVLFTNSAVAADSFIYPIVAGANNAGTANTNQFVRPVVVGTLTLSGSLASATNLNLSGWVYFRK